MHETMIEADGIICNAQAHTTTTIQVYLISQWSPEVSKEIYKIAGEVIFADQIAFIMPNQRSQRTEGDRDHSR